MRWLLRSPLLLALSACLPEPVLVGADDTGDCEYTPTWYHDGDADGHGDPDAVVLRCTQPEGYVEAGDDCDDADAAVWQGEVAWPDADGDGYGSEGWEELICGAAGSGQATRGGDCDDADDAVHEDAPAVCGDEIDNNCDGLTDCPIPEGELSPADADADLVGEFVDELGVSVAVVGDVNQDLLEDVLVGMPRGEAGESVPGEAILVLGPFSGERAVDEAIALVGAEALDDAGRAVGAAGDVNEDGVPDLLIGARRHGSSNAGAVYVELGPVTASGALGAGAVILGEAEGGLLGGAVLGEVDLLGEDGLAEIVIGAPGTDSSAGAVWLVSAPLQAGSAPVSSLATAGWTTSAGGQLGAALAHLGDADGDGVAELAIGAPVQSVEGHRLGAVWVLPADAPAGDVSAVALGWLSGPGQDSLFGLALAGAGDVDGDGLDDLLVGAPGWEEDPGAGGAAFVVGAEALVGASGGGVGADVEALATLYSSGVDEGAGYAVLGAGDMNADGEPDLCVGAPDAEGGAEEAEVGGLFCWYGPVDGALPLENADFFFRGDEADGRVGAAAAVASDLNGLDVPDLLVGAPGEVTSYAWEGDAHVFLLLGDGF